MISSGLLRLWLDPLLSSHESLREDLEGKKVLVTGVSGFVGSWVTAALLRFAETGTNLRVAGVARNPGRILDRFDQWLDTTPLELTAADLAASSSLPACDLVIHASGEVSREASAQDLLKNIVTASDRVAFHASSTGTSRFLFVSSGAAYGPQPASISCIDETFSGAPDSCGGDLYGNMKRWGETLSMIHGKTSGMAVMISRCFSFSGAFLPLNGRFALGNFVRDALAGGPVRVLGSGTPIRSYLDGADMAFWLLTALLRGKNGCCYNIGSPDPISIADAAAAVARIFGCPFIVEDGADGMLRYVPCAGKSKRELGLTPTIGIAESVHRMELWYKGSAK